MSESFEHLLTDTVDFLVETKTRTGSGSSVSSYATLYENVACKIRPVSNQGRGAGSFEQIKNITHRLYCLPSDVELADNEIYRVEWNLQIFRVVNFQDVNNLGRFLQVDLQQVAV